MILFAQGSMAHAAEVFRIDWKACFGKCSLKVAKQLKEVMNTYDA